MTTWLLLVVLYTGEVKELTFISKQACEDKLLLMTDLGERKHMSIAECIPQKDKQ
jgi:hypothetical protein